MRLLALALVVIGILFAGRAGYELLWFGHIAWPSTLLGVGAIGAGYLLFRRSRQVDRPSPDAR